MLKNTLKSYFLRGVGEKVVGTSFDGPQQEGKVMFPCSGIVLHLNLLKPYSCEGWRRLWPDEKMLKLYVITGESELTTFGHGQNCFLFYNYCKPFDFCLVGFF